MTRTDIELASDFVHRWGALSKQRRAVLGSRLMLVTGELQHEQGVINVLARRIEDYSGWLGTLRTESRDFR